MRMIFDLLPNEIFVFGSNNKGIHAGGAAKQAIQWGAQMNKAEGIMKKTYGIITMDWDTGEFLGWDNIQHQFEKFIEFASQNGNLKFLLTPIGTGIAGASIEDLDQFVDKFELPSNIELLWR